MLDALRTLDPDAFACLEDAYGPAVDVPEQLRRLADEDLEVAREGLDQLYAGIFHQGSYFSATPVATEFLVELAATELPARPDVLLLLARMSGVAAEPELAFQPYVWRSAPGQPTYPEAVATIARVRSGHATYLNALSSADPRVRACAAYLLAALAGGEREGAAGAEVGAVTASEKATGSGATTRDGLGDALEAALRTESVLEARVSLVFALARLGRRAPRRTDGDLAADVLDTLTLAEEPERGLAAVARLLVHEQNFEPTQLPFFDGDLVRFAATALQEHGRPLPGAFEVAERALLERLARGERIAEQHVPSTPRIRDEAGAVASAVDYFADLPLRSIAGAMSALAFGELPPSEGLLQRDALDDRQRRVLALTRDHGIPVPVGGAPWITPTAMARFLLGGGPLDEPFTWHEESAPLFVLLAPLAHADTPEASAELDALLADLAQRWSAEQLLALVIDVLEESYDLAPWGASDPLMKALSRHVDRLAPQCVDRLEQYAEQLLTREFVTGTQAALALATTLAANEPVAPRLDRLAGQAIAADVDGRKSWLARFPEPRRSRIVARLGNTYLLSRLRDVCEPAALEDALVDAFLDPDCAWFAHDAEGLLTILRDTARLTRLCQQSTGRRRAVLARVLQARTGAGAFTLDLAVEGDGLRATVRCVGDETPRVVLVLALSPSVDELRVVVEVCVAPGIDAADTQIELRGDVDSTTEYRVMRVLADAGFRGRIVAGNSSYARVAD